MARKEFRVGVVGYGGAFNMGKRHLDTITQNAGFVAAAVCDPDASRLKVAEKDFPGIKTFTNVTALLKENAVDLAIIITPHDSHAKLVLQFLQAGVHAVCEKPLAIKDTDALEMLQVAKRKKLMLSAFHNRRWDGDYLALQNIVAEGWLGRIFSVECNWTQYRVQPDWWRASRKISGGSIYDWGAHFTDWVLNLLPGKIAHVSGFQVKNPAWGGYDNEDHCEFKIRFTDNCQATMTYSNLTMIPGPRWRVLGEKGALIHGGDHWLVKTFLNGRVVETKIPFLEDNWDAYYVNVTAHLLKRKKLVVTPDSAARVIGVLSAAYKSSAKEGMPVKPLWQ